MTNEILEKYIGKMILVETDQERHRSIPYLGRLSSYNENFIVLNPCDRVNPTYVGEVEKMVEKLKEFKAGETDSEKILGKGVIASIEELVVKEN